jgi:hypothetical protein
MPRDRAPLVIGAILVGTIGAVPTLAAIGAFHWVVGWSFEYHTPPRTIVFPLLFWIVVAGYIAILRRGDGTPLATAVARGFALVATVEIARSLVPLRAEASAVDLQGVYALYVRLAQLLLFLSIGAISGLGAVRWRPWVMPLTVAAAITLGRLAIEHDVINASALIAGAVIVGLAARAGWRVPLPVDPARRWALVAILVLLVAVRMLFVVVLLRAHGLDYPLATDDGPSYDDNAWRLATGLGAEVPANAFYFNIYVVLLAGIYAIVGHSFLIVGFIQACLAAGSAWCMFWIGRRLAGAAVGAIAALAMAVNSVLVELAAGIGTEALAIPLLTAAMALLVWLIGLGGRSRPILAAFGAGAMLGLIGVTRDVMLGLPLFLTPWIVWALARSRIRTRTAVAITALFLVGALLAYLPFSLYRDRFNFASSYLVPVAYSLGHAELNKLGIGPTYGMGPSLAAIAAHPADAIGAVARESWEKLDMLMLSSTFGSFDPTFLIQRSQYAAAAETYFLIAVLFGILLLVARRTLSLEIRVLLLLLPAYGIVAHVILFHANAAFRYRALYDPVFAIAFGLAVVTIWRAARSLSAPRATTNALPPPAA